MLYQAGVPSGEMLGTWRYEFCCGKVAEELLDRGSSNFAGVKISDVVSLLKLHEFAQDGLSL